MESEIAPQIDTVEGDHPDVPEAPWLRPPRKPRERVLSWLKRADAEGLLERDWLQLGSPPQRLIAWRDEERRIAATVVPEPVIPRPTESTALVPVAVRDAELLPFGPMISFSAPGGDTIGGLTMDQAIGLLRLFG